MSVLSKSVAIVLAAMLIASAYALTPLVVGAAVDTEAINDAYGAIEGVQIDVAAPGVRSNDVLGDSATLITAVNLASDPSIPGTFSLANDGSFSFMPTDTNFSGDVTFTYTLTDDLDFTSAPATVTITFAPENDVPTATNQSLNVALNTAAVDTLSGADVDAGAVLAYAVITNPTNGSVVVDAATGAFTYTPNTDYVGPDSFTWDTNDGTASSTAAMVDITVAAADENTLALCSNGTDNDADGRVDLDDSDCAPFLPQIGISVVIINDQNGAATTTDVQLIFDEMPTSGATTTSTAGAHVVTSKLTGYARTIGGDCAADGAIMLVAGSVAHCVVTYNDFPGSALATGVGIIENTTPVPASSGSVLGAATSTASTTLPELPEGCTPMLSGFFRKENMDNDIEQVKKLQQFLNEKIQTNLPLTGEFGAGTDAAVKQFQRAYAEQILAPWGISSPTGFVYLTTQRWINLMSCSTLDIPMPKLVPYRG